MINVGDLASFLEQKGNNFCVSAQDFLNSRKLFLKSDPILKETIVLTDGITGKIPAALNHL